MEFLRSYHCGGTVVNNVVGYSRRIYQGLGLFEGTLLLGFQVVLVYLHKLKHRKELMWLDLDLDLGLDFCLGEIELAQWIRQDVKLVSWVIRYA